MNASTPRAELRTNTRDWTQPIVQPPITEYDITRAALGGNPKLRARLAKACRAAAGRCLTAAAASLLDSAARAWRAEADELDATARLLERLP